MDAHGGSDICLVETHLQGTALTQAVKKANRIGYKAAMIEAVATPDALRAGPGHGGVAILHRKTIHARALKPLEKESVQQEEHQGMRTQWTATTVRVEAMDIVVGTAYLAPGMGLQGSNWTTLLELSDYLHVQGLPFIVVGDFNNDISEMESANM